MAADRVTFTRRHPVMGDTPQHLVDWHLDYMRRELLWEAWSAGFYVTEMTVAEPVTVTEAYIFTRKILTVTASAYPRKDT